MMLKKKKKLFSRALFLLFPWQCRQLLTREASAFEHLLPAQLSARGCVCLCVKAIGLQVYNPALVTQGHTTVQSHRDFSLCVPDSYTHFKNLDIVKVLTQKCIFVTATSKVWFLNYHYTDKQSLFLKVCPSISVPLCCFYSCVFTKVLSRRVPISVLRRRRSSLKYQQAHPNCHSYSLLFVCFLLLFLKTGPYSVALAVLEFTYVDQAGLGNSVSRMLG